MWIMQKGVCSITAGKKHLCDYYGLHKPKSNLFGMYLEGCVSKEVENFQ